MPNQWAEAYAVLGQVRGIGISLLLGSTTEDQALDAWMNLGLERSVCDQILEWWVVAKRRLRAN